jgi:hypothetical protein
MRTTLIILAGVFLGAAFLGTARWLAPADGRATRTALILFAIIWIAAAAVNMWFGVTRAGYSAREEFPIFLVIAAVPIALVGLVGWKFF